VLEMLTGIPDTHTSEAEQSSWLRLGSGLPFHRRRSVQPMLISIAIIPFDNGVSAATRNDAVLGLRIAEWKE
jgi:hypothetical protein